MNIVHNPTKDELNQLYYAIGAIVVSWSFIEQPLDIWVSIIYQKCDGRNVVKKYEDEVPCSMTSKTYVLEKCFKKLDILLPFKDDALSLIKQAINFSKKRNEMIHMSLVGKTSDNLFRFNKMEYRSIHESRLVSYSITQFHEFEKEIRILRDQMRHLSTRLLKQFLLP